jgi:hypothetical protein
MRQRVYVYEFPADQEVENPLFAPEPQRDLISRSAKAGGAKVDVNRVDEGTQTMKVRFPSTEAEAVFKIGCAVAPTRKE